MNISTFSNEKIATNLEALVGREMLTTIQILHHLNEIENRELHLKLGYSSLWDYATRGLLYSEPAAHRRIGAARSLKSFPSLEPLLASRKLNLTTLSLVSTLLSPESFEEVIKSISGKTKREVEAFLARYRPVKRVVEKVTPVCVSLPAAPKTPSLSLPKAEEPPSPKSGSLREKPVLHSQEELSPKKETQVYKLQCAVSEEGYKKLKEVESLLSHKASSLGQVVEQLCEYYLSKKSPENCTLRPKQASSTSRYVPVSVRKTVWERDGGCCSYIGRDGQKCGSKKRLQWDHIKPFALGGKTEAENIRLVCQSHNAFLAKQAFGESKITVHGCRNYYKF